MAFSTRLRAPIESEVDDICAWRQPRSTPPLAGSQVRFLRVSGSEALFPLFHRRASFPQIKTTRNFASGLVQRTCVVRWCLCSCRISQQ